jgi:hypothetical protein
MIKQHCEQFAISPAVHDQVLYASSNQAQHRGKVMGRIWMGRLASAGIKSCAILAVLALSMASRGAGQEQVRPAEEKIPIKPITEQERAIVTHKPNPEELETWRKTILKTPRLKKACFKATYPETEWHEVACKTPPNKPYPPRHGIRTETVGNGPDFSPVVTGHITEAEGSFDSVTPSNLSECSVPCPIDSAGDIVCPTSPSCSDFGAEPNAYSLQLNSKPFTTSACSGSPASTTPACQGWEQFVYEGAGSAFIQYWLENYGPAGTSCPTSPPGLPAWNTFQFKSTGNVYCWINAVNGGAATSEPITSLQGMIVTGSAAGIHSADDSLVVKDGGTTLFSAPGDNRFPDLGTQWQEVEFNVFGDGSGSQAVFSSGTTIHVRTGVDSGTTLGPGCDEHSFTGESNNLTLGNTPPTAVKGNMPALLFWESNPAPAGTSASCADATSVGDTHLTAFSGLYYDFQATGDFVLMQDGPDFVVHTRQASGAPIWPEAAVNKAVAVKMGNTRVAVYVEPVRLVIDGKAANLADGKKLLLPTGVQLSRHGNLYIITSEDGNSVSAVLNSAPTMWWINVTVGLGHTLGQTRGLLGNPRGFEQVIATSAGVVLNEPVSFTDLYHAYAESWRVKPNESLFTEATTIRPGIPSKPFFAADLDTRVAAPAEAACREAGVTEPALLESCILDTAVLGDKVAVKAFVLARQPLHVMKPVLHLAPMKEVEK